MDEVTGGEYAFDSDKLAVVLEGSGMVKTSSQDIELRKGDKLLFTKGERIILPDNNIRLLICG